MALVDATESFLVKADWIGDNEVAEVEALRMLARNLDAEFVSSGMAQYRLLLGALKALRPTAAPTSPSEELDSDPGDHTMGT